MGLDGSIYCPCSPITPPLSFNVLIIYFGALPAQLFAYPCPKVQQSRPPCLVFADVFSVGFTRQQRLRAVHVKNLLLVGYCRNSFFANFEKKGSTYTMQIPGTVLPGPYSLAAFLCGLADWIVDMVETYHVDAPPRSRGIS